MHADSSGDKIIDSILPYSRYLQRLLESEPEYCLTLSENLSAFSREEMLAYLNANSNNTNDESGLHYVLRSLRKRVMSRLAVRD